MTTVTIREQVTAEIKAHLDSIGSAYIKVGNCLNELREDFDGQKEFLAYVEEEFSIKKAQCYKLMALARTFGDDKRFSGVAMRVMSALVQFADDQAIMDKAAELAADGKLDTKAVNALINPEPARKPTMEPAIAAPYGDKPQELQAVPQQGTVPADSDEADDGLPWDDEPSAPATVTAPEQAAEKTEAAPVQTTAPAYDSGYVNSLLATIDRLNNMVNELGQKLAAKESERETKKASAPMLPQFNSKCFYARLGLSAEEATKKTAISKARRELVKLGYGTGHEAYPLIEEAVKALTEAL